MEEGKNEVKYYIHEQKEKELYRSKTINKKAVRYTNVGVVWIELDTYPRQTLILRVRFTTWNRGNSIVIDRVSEDEGDLDIKDILKDEVIKDILASIVDGRMDVRATKVSSVRSNDIEEEIFYKINKTD